MWVLGLFLLCLYIGNYGYFFSAPMMIQRVTGFSAMRVGIVAMLGVLAALAMLLNSAHADRKREHYLHVALPCALIAAGFAAAGLSSRAAIVIPAFACVMMGLSAISAPVWSIPHSFSAASPRQPASLRSTRSPSSAAFSGPYWMGLATDLTGGYQRGLLTLVVPTSGGNAPDVRDPSRCAAEKDGSPPC